MQSYGRLQTVLALGGFAGLLANPGLGTVALRRSARRPSSVARLASRVQPVRFAFALLAGVALIAGCWAVSPSPELRLMAAIQAAILVVQGMSVDPYLLGIGDIAWVGYSRAMALALYAGGVLAGVHTPRDAVAVLGVTLACTVIVTLAGSLRLRRHAGRFSWAPRRRSNCLLLAESLGFGLSSVMSLVYARIDVLFLQAYMGEGAVGLYSAAVRMTEGVYGVLNVILGTIFPRAVTERTTSPRRADALAQRALRLACIFVLPAAAGAAVAGGPLLAWLAGPAFGGADSLLVVLGLVPVAGAAASIYTGFGLTGQGRARAVLVCTTVGALTNLGLNFAAIPLWGPVGAAATTLIAQAAVALAARRFADPPLRLSPGKAALPWAGPCAVMAVVVLLLRLVGAAPVYLLVLGAGTYALTIRLFGSLSRSERRGWRQLLGWRRSTREDSPSAREKGPAIGRL